MMYVGFCKLKGNLRDKMHMASHPSFCNADMISKLLDSGRKMCLSYLQVHEFGCLKEPSHQDGHALAEKPKKNTNYIFLFGASLDTANLDDL